jgi:hypothetical protein
MDYPFDYWENRIQKLTPGNPHDALDALFLHSHLADVYVTALTARMKRPNFAWYVIKDELPTREIYSTLESLEETLDGETRYFVEKLLEKPEGFVSVDLPDGWAENVDYETAFANQFLGCPAEFNSSEQAIEPIYEPDGYMALCNLVLNYWDQTTDYLNDFKHGFRIIPFSWERLEWLYEEDLVAADVDLKTVQDGYTEPESDWTFDFWRMASASDSEPGTPVHVEIHTADIERCVAFSKLTLKLLFNLFDQERKKLFEEEFETLFGSRTVSPGDTQKLIHEQYSLETRFYENEEQAD